METKDRTLVSAAVRLATPITHEVSVQFAFGADWKAECSCKKWYRLGYRHQERAVRAAEAHAVEHGGTVKVVTR